jgi:hypothetical protein
MPSTPVALLVPGMTPAACHPPEKHPLCQPLLQADPVHAVNTTATRARCVQQHTNHGRAGCTLLSLCRSDTCKQLASVPANTWLTSHYISTAHCCMLVQPGCAPAAAGVPGPSVGAVGMGLRGDACSGGVSMSHLSSCFMGTAAMSRRSRVSRLGACTQCADEHVFWKHARITHAAISLVCARGHSQLPTGGDGCCMLHHVQVHMA